MEIIAICGRKGSGKTTLSNEIMYNDMRYHRLSFAGAIKSMLLDLLAYQGVSVEEAMEYIYYDKKEEPCPYIDNQTMRLAQQTLGSEWGRDLISTHLWANVFYRKLKNSRLSHVIIDDLRFPNELERVRELGALVVRVRREGLDESDAHPSETHHLSFNVDIDLQNPIPATASDIIVNTVKNRKLLFNQFQQQLTIFRGLRS